MAGSLHKRQCVSDCPIPSCASLNCGRDETCILSTQTCDQCPAVSCVSLNLTAGPPTPKSPTLPKGGIAGVVIITILLLCSFAYLGMKIQKRRRNLQQIAEKSLEEHEDSSRQSTANELSRSSTGLASIQIQLEPGVGPSVSRAQSSVTSTTGHFFSADELLRMSYADSMASRVSVATVGDTGAAIMQPNNPVVAVRAKAAVMQLVKGSASVSDGQLSPTLTLQQQQLRKTSALESCFEDDEESILDSPVERDFIAPSRFSDASAMSSRSTMETGKRQPRTSPLGKRTSERNGRSLTGSVVSISTTTTAPSISLPLGLSRPISGLPDFDRGYERESTTLGTD